MAMLSLSVIDVVGGEGRIESPPDLQVFVMPEEYDPVLQFVMGSIGREVLAFSVSGYDDIAMLMGFCEQVLKAADRMRAMPNSGY